MKYLAVLFLFASAFAGDASELLAERPEAPYVSIDGEVQKKHGFILWTPTLTLAHAIEVAGGFTPKAKVIWIERLAKDPAPDLHLGKAAFLRDRKIQNQRFHPGDRIWVWYPIPPW